MCDGAYVYVSVTAARSLQAERVTPPARSAQAPYERYGRTTPRTSAKVAHICLVGDGDIYATRVLSP